jgi:hypothetical protein
VPLPVAAEHARCDGRPAVVRSARVHAREVSAR